MYRRSLWMGAFVVCGVSGLVSVAYADGYAPAPVAYDRFSWTGLYIGGHAGWQQGNLDGSDTTDPFRFTFTQGPVTWDSLSSSSPIHQRFDGGIGGLQVGYNHQFQHVVVGTELSATFGNVTGSGNCFGAGMAPGTITNVTVGPVTVLERLNKDCSTKQDWSVQWLQKVGLTQGRLLGYLTGGVALTEVKFDRHWRTNAEADVAGVSIFSETNEDRWSGSETHAGVVLGGGLQYAIANNVSFGVEYLHTQYGSADSLTSGTTTFTQCFGAACTSASAHLHATSTNTLDTDTVRAVLNFKFGPSYEPLK